MNKIILCSVTASPDNLGIVGTKTQHKKSKIAVSTGDGRNIQSAIVKYRTRNNE